MHGIVYIYIFFALLLLSPECLLKCLLSGLLIGPQSWAFQVQLTGQLQPADS